MNDNELKHYGVLGMKWGQHRAKKYEAKARNARLSADEWDEIGSYQKSKRRSAKYAKYAAEDRAAATKYQAKAKKIENYHRDMGGKKTYDHVKNVSTGKAVAQSLVFGTYGALKYNSAKAKGVGRGIAAVKGSLYGFGNRLTLGGLGIVEPRVKRAVKRSNAYKKVDTETKAFRDAGKRATKNAYDKTKNVAKDKYKKAKKRAEAYAYGSRQ